jgi:hypothetical protein
MQVLQLASLPDSHMARVLSNVGALALTSEGYNTILEHLAQRDIQVTSLLLPFITENDQPARIEPPAASLIFNAICNPDACAEALATAQELIRQLKLPVINRPEGVALTARDRLYPLLHGIPNLVIPPTLRIHPRRQREVAQLIEAGTLSYPFIFRPTGTHDGRGMLLLHGPADLEGLEAYALDGQPYYVTQFVDYRSPDGLYRKYRFYVVGNGAFPRHLLIADDWNIHASSRKRLMDGNAALREEERAFLGMPRPELGAIFSAIRNKVQLDFFAVDAGFDQQGRMIIFEVSVCAELLLKGGVPPALEYHRKPVDNILRAVVSLIRERATGHV